MSIAVEIVGEMVNNSPLVIFKLQQADLGEASDNLIVSTELYNGHAL